MEDKTSQEIAPLISLVVPCYNEAEALPYFMEDALKAVQKLKEEDSQRGKSKPVPAFEFIFVDDGSTDRTLKVIKDLAKKYGDTYPIYFVALSRNFGKESALYAGLEAAKGDYIVTMDADMQDPPSLLPSMWQVLQEEHVDNVATRRVSRAGEPLIRSWFARRFYRLMNKISPVNIADGARDFRFMNRKMVDAILSLKEKNRFSKGIWAWVGYTTKWIPYENQERVAGETKWNFWSLFLYSLDGIEAFSTAPLAVSSLMGFILCFTALILIVVIIVRTLAFGDPVAGWPSLACLIIFVGGLQLLSSGIIGQYLAKTYIETKNRPIYLVSESNLDTKK